MAAGEHEAQPAVLQFIVEVRRCFGFGRPVLDRSDDLRFLVAKKFFPPDQIESEILGCLREPCGWICRNAVKRPGLESLGQGFLNDVFGEIEPFDSENACQD